MCICVTGEHAGGQEHQLANNNNNNQRRTNGHARGGMRGGGRGGRGGRGGPVGDRQNGRAGGGGGRNQARVDRPDRQRDTESRNTEEISTLISAKIIEAVDPLDVNVAVTNAAKELESTTVAELFFILNFLLNVSSFVLCCDCR